MRIISGKHKGRRIIAPRLLPVRPTTDMAKEALFNILYNSYAFDGLSVLDLYSGTGNISYEFASRGAVSVTSVEADRNCVAFIKKTAAVLEFPITALRGLALDFLENTRQNYDIIFADPPYDRPLEEFEKIRELVFARKLLKENGLLVIEHGRHTDLSGGEFFGEDRKYGGSIFSFFRP